MLRMREVIATDEIVEWFGGSRLKSRRWSTLLSAC